MLFRAKKQSKANVCTVSTPCTYVRNHIACLLPSRHTFKTRPMLNESRTIERKQNTNDTTKTATATSNQQPAATTTKLIIMFIGTSWLSVGRSRAVHEYCNVYCVQNLYSVHAYTHARIHHTVIMITFSELFNL